MRGHRFRSSLGTDDEEAAEIIAAKTRSDALLARVANRKPELALTHALGRYWLEHAQYLPSGPDIARYGRNLIAGLGAQTLLSELTADSVAKHIARRRAKVANRTVNMEIEHLRAVIRRAGKVWGAAVPDPELPWKKLLLDEAGARQHILSVDEERRLFAVLRPDLHPMVRFALVSGARLGNVIGLTWKQIDWDAATITWRVKSRKPGGRQIVLPLTAALAAILSVERGNHPEFVFTYVTQRTRYDPRRRKLQRRGQRDPFTRHGWRRVWRKALEAAKIAEFRFHDLRHTAATRKLRAPGGRLPRVKEMLGHQDIATTMRYAHTELDDVRDMMEAEERQSQSSHTGRQKAPEIAGKTGG